MAAGAATATPRRRRAARGRSERLSTRKGDPDSLLRYAPDGETLIEHGKRSDYAQVLIGPLGSAKTTSTIIKILRLWSAAPVDPADGIRRSRWAAVRNTYPDLIGTTIKDFLEMVEPLKIGEFSAAERGKGSPIFRAEFVADDGVETHAEITFLAFDLPQDVKKARGLRLSGAWFNEMKELSKANVDMVMSRLGRFRPDLHKQQPWCWYGALGDSNAPDSDHWLAKLVEQRPKGWWFGIQPGAVVYRDGRFTVNPSAENLRNLAPGYYERMMAGKDEYWIRQNLGNEFVYYSDGRPVHPNFSQRLHVAGYELQPTPGIELTLGVDWGRTPAMAVLQRQPNGRWFVLDEVIGTNTSARPFGRVCQRFLSDRYPGYEYEGTGDPSGDAGGQATDDTCFEQFAGDYESPGVTVYPAHTNNFAERTEALDSLLRELIDGEPAILISPRCRTIIRGLAGAYRFRRVQVSGVDRWHDKPEKSPESHPVEGLHYALMGAGEGAGLVSETFAKQNQAVLEEYGGWRPPARYFE